MFGLNFFRRKKPDRLAGSEGRYLKSFDGTKIYYDVNRVENGRGFLIFLHGLGGDMTAWNAERKTFKELGYSTLALDLRGHGLSDRPRELKSYAMENFVQDVLTIIDKESINDCSVIGHCFGGMITILLGASSNPKIRSIILVDTSFKPPYFSQVVSNHKFLYHILAVLLKHAPDIGFKTEREFKNYIGTSDYDLRRILADISYTSLRSYLLSLEEFSQFDAVSLLDKIKVKTLIIEGLKDTIFPPHVAKELAHRIKNSKIGFIPDANHILVINNPFDLAMEIDLFLNQN